MKLRLDRLLVTLGRGSRSELQRLIRSGRISVQGCVQRDPGAPVSDGDVVAMDGALLDTRLTRHVMLNKPAGLLTAARDKKQPTVMSLLPPEYGTLGCMPVGRLDKDTTGLLLLTTDGTLNHRLLAPQRHVNKTYIALLDAPVTKSDIAAFAAGLSLSDFEAESAALEALPDNRARVTIHEGKFHQVKRMFGAVGREVLALHRETFGSLALDESLPCGQWRELTPEEISALYADAQMEESHG